MNTFSKLSLALVSMLACGALAGCGDQAGTNEMNDDAENDEGEMVAEAEQAIITPVTPPVLSAGTMYRVQIMPQTDVEDPAQKCVDFPGSSEVTLGQPLVRRTCNNQQLGNDNNTQAFYFEPLYVGGNIVPNRYYMKPAHTSSSSGALCVYSSGASTANGGNLLAGICNPGTDARLVDIKSYTDDTTGAQWPSFQTINMVHSGKCLTVVGAYPGEYVTITQYGTSNNADAFCGVWTNQRVRILTQ